MYSLKSIVNVPLIDGLSHVSTLAVANCGKLFGAGQSLQGIVDELLDCELEPLNDEVLLELELLLELASQEGQSSKRRVDAVCVRWRV